MTVSDVPVISSVKNCKFDILYVDAPWSYRGLVQTGGQKGKYCSGAHRYYPTMSLDNLKALDIRSVCKRDCLIFMWATGPNLDQAIELMGAWGFRYATVGFVWEKKATNPGAYTMSSVELCLIGKRGNIPKPRGARNVRQFVAELRTSHSTKPEEVRKRIEEMFPSQQKLELFARKRTEGWAVWGNEVSADIELGVTNGQDSF